VIASLPMYDWAGAPRANDRFWTLIRDRLRRAGIDAPDTLSRHEPITDIWDSPNLVLSQTCSLPFRMGLNQHKLLVAAPDYGHRNCPPGYYRSAFVVRADDPRSEVGDYQNAVLAINEKISHSGWAAPLLHAQDLGFTFWNLLETGAHRESARAIAKRHADIAAIDVLSWAMVQKYDDHARDLRVIGWTAATPAPPFITSLSLPHDVVFDALAGAIDALSPSDAHTLHLQGLVHIPPATYCAVRAPDTSPLPPPERRASA